MVSSTPKCQARPRISTPSTLLSRTASRCWKDATQRHDRATRKASIGRSGRQVDAARRTPISKCNSRASLSCVDLRKGRIGTCLTATAAPRDRKSQRSKGPRVEVVNLETAKHAVRMTRRRDRLRAPSRNRLPLISNSTAAGLVRNVARCFEQLLGAILAFFHGRRQKPHHLRRRFAN